MPKNKKIIPHQQVEPPRCYVGDRAKIIYKTAEDAEVAARNAEIDHQLPPGSLQPYKCEYADHYHLTRT
ncbi:hypothetical protein FWH13_03800 [Candidatus Saccharibacteria bacterium]|nr:hypothetical protein [Candidatus Saccharibacteria bacterium]